MDQPAALRLARVGAGGFPPASASPSASPSAPAPAPDDSEQRQQPASSGSEQGSASSALASIGLIAHGKALDAAGTALRLVMRLPTPLMLITDQVIRAASSVPANLAEGHGRFGRDRLHFWRIAYASAKEVDSHLRLLAATGAVSSSAAAAALDRFDQVRAMIWRLLNPRA